MAVFSSLISAVISASLLSLVAAWGQVGHATTGFIAQALLSSRSKGQVSDILGGQTLADVADWADQVKRQPAYSWSASLHYINTPDWACEFEPSRDCPNNWCVTGALFNYSKQLSPSGGFDPDTQAVALKFITHFMGDAHQPLHVGFGSDRGGNDIRGYYYSGHTNLHAIWDDGIINSRIKAKYGGSSANFMNGVLNRLTNEWASYIPQWGSCSAGNPVDCPNEWASDSASIACKFSYVNVDGSHLQSNFQLSADYYNHNVDEIEMQLAKGGVRLASFINGIFS